MTKTEEQKFDPISFTMGYEGEELSEKEIVDGFQELINSGLVWQLQGSYGRQAQSLIDAGMCTRPVSVNPEPGTSSNIGPYVGVSRDQIRQVGNEKYRILLYSAYNAMGLVGYESNGISVLSEDRSNVVCDELGCESSGYHRASENQQKLYDKLITCPESEFRDIVNGSSRNRYAI